MKPKYKTIYGKGRVKLGEVTREDRDMVAREIANGFPITKCPPMQFSVEAGQPEPGSMSEKQAEKNRTFSKSRRTKQHAIRNALGVSEAARRKAKT